jgi:hypothetical protein
MTADAGLAELRADAARRAPRAPGLDAVIEDTGRQRLAAYYLYSALIAGVLGDRGAAPAQWPHEYTEPTDRLGLTRFTPRTEPGLDAQLTPAEQAAWRSPDRSLKYLQLLTNLINQGAFGPLCGNAESVRPARPGSSGLDLELLVGGKVVGRCKAKDHWELVAQYLAGLTQDGDLQAAAAGGPAHSGKIARQLKETGISHAVSVTTTLAVSVHPIGAAAGLGTRLVRSRIRADHDEADALHHLGQVLRSLRDQACGELPAVQRRGLPGSPVDEADLVRVDHRLDPVAQPELRQHPSEVRLHSRLGDEEPLGDLGVGEAAGELRQDRQLPGCELVELGVGRSGCGLRVPELVRERVEEAPGHTRGDDGVPGGDGPDGADELGRQDVLQDKAAGAETERPERVLVQIESRQDQDTRTWLGRNDGSRRLNPVHACHPDVHHDDVRVAAADEIERRRAVGGLADDDDACLLLQDHAEARAQERLIVDEDDRDRVVAGLAVVHGAPRSVIGIIASTVHPPCRPGPASAVPP